MTRNLERFDRDLLTFVLNWAPYGGPPDDECLIQFGMSADRVRQRCHELICTARPHEYEAPESQLLLRASRAAGVDQRRTASANGRADPVRPAPR
jgi:hypothetical protein